MPENVTEAIVEELVVAGAAGWPDLDLDRGGFHAHIAAILTGHDDTAPGSLFVTDLFLAFCCARGVSRAIEAFDREYGTEVESAVRRLDPSPAFIDDVRQRLRITLFVADGQKPPKIATYSGRGPLGAWTCVTAQRIALRLRKQSDKGESGEEQLLDALTQDAEPSLSYLKERYRGELRDALYAAFETLSSRDRLLLQLHFVQHLTMERVAAIYCVHQTTVSRWLKTIRDRVLFEANSSLRKKLGLSASECESIVRLVQSQLDINMSRLFEDRDVQ